MTEEKPEQRLRYRLLTGPDDATFCQRVSQALADGYPVVRIPGPDLRRGTGGSRPSGDPAREITGIGPGTTDSKQSYRGRTTGATGNS
ncbi:DUF1737 domain-containing protein [Micromonospora sp. NPDC003197]